MLLLHCIIICFLRFGSWFFGSLVSRVILSLQLYTRIFKLIWRDIDKRNHLSLRFCVSILFLDLFFAARPWAPRPSPVPEPFHAALRAFLWILFFRLFRWILQDSVFHLQTLACEAAAFSLDSYSAFDETCKLLHFSACFYTAAPRCEDIDLLWKDAALYSIARPSPALCLFIHSLHHVSSTYLPHISTHWGFISHSAVWLAAGQHVRVQVTWTC